MFASLRPPWHNVRPYRPRLGLGPSRRFRRESGRDNSDRSSGSTSATFADISVIISDRRTAGQQLLQADAVFLDLSVLGGYQNERRRWSWGISGGNSPIPSLASGSAIGLYNQRTCAARTGDHDARSPEVTGLFTRNLGRARHHRVGHWLEHLSFRCAARFTATSVFDGVKLTTNASTCRRRAARLHWQLPYRVRARHVGLWRLSPVMGERYRFARPASLAALGCSRCSPTTVAMCHWRDPAVAGWSMHYGALRRRREDPRMGGCSLAIPLLRGYDSDTIAWLRPSVGNDVLRQPAPRWQPGCGRQP